MTCYSTSIFEISKNSSMSLHNTEILTKMVSESLPELRQGIASLEKEMQSTAKETKLSQQLLESQVLTCLRFVEEYMLDMRKLQQFAMGKTRVEREVEIRWQMDLRRSIQHLQSCTTAQLRLLLQIIPKYNTKDTI